MTVHRTQQPNLKNRYNTCMPHSSRLSLAADVLFHHLLTPQKKPFLASYKLTYRCNLRCRQCPFPYLTSPDPTYAQVCTVLDQLYARGDRIVIFEGGEPLLWKDGAYNFNAIARYARQKFACTGATTNGTLPLDAETDILWVSLDGFGPTHNSLRGAEIYDRVIENIRRSTHPRLYAHITANAENHAEIPELIRYLSGLVRGITVQFYYPYGADDRLFLPGPDRKALLDRLIALKREGFPVLNSSTALRALRENTWKCQSWRIDCANPDGALWQGCYLKGRADSDCSKCGFSPYTEMSLAFQGHPGSILAGMRIFA
jgi:Fe-coproporphyrin III synthase